MHRLALATSFVALSSGCLFGPPGNALGLEGEYVGTIKSDLSGAVTYYNGGQTTNASVEGINDTRALLTLEKGYGDVDALLSGLGCPAPLVVSGGTLVLMDDAECTTESDNTVEVGGQTSRNETIETIEITDLTVTSNGTGAISVEASASRETEDRQNDERTETSSLDIEFEFNGTRVGGE